MNAEVAAILMTSEDLPVPLTGVQATGHLTGLLFELEVEQRYENRTDTNIEAVYTFPVPLEAAFMGLEIEIGPRRLVARAKRTDQARRDYEVAIDEGNTAVLLERADDGLYTVSLGNLLANEKAVIRYRYAELLDVVQGAARLRIPTVIAPRYGDPGRRVQPHQVPGVDLLADYPFGLKIIIEGLLAEAPLTSPTHPIHTGREGSTRIVTLAGGARLDRDFVLSGELGAFKGASVTARDGEGYVSLVSWVPALAGLETAAGLQLATPLALKILIDCSGSMCGDSIAQARRALAAIVARLTPSDTPSAPRDAGSVPISPWKQAIERLNSMLPWSGVGPGVGCGGRIDLDPPAACDGGSSARDFVALTRFGSRVERITNGLQPVTPELIAQLRSVAGSLQADLGGTELPGALRDVVSQPTNGAANPAVLLITDGEIWAIDQALAAVAAAGHRLFVVAVGAAPNEALARRVAEVTNGACEFVTPGENMERTIVNMARRVREPLNRITEVRWPVTPAWTTPWPSAVFSGDTVHLLAGFTAEPEGLAIVSVGDGAGNTRQLTPVAVSSIVSAGDTLARLAAARRLAALPQEEAAALAERYQLASQWTAFVVVDEREAKARGLPVLATVQQMLAAGWGGVGSVSARMASVELSVDFDRVGAVCPEPVRSSYRLVSEDFAVAARPQLESDPGTHRRLRDFLRRSAPGTSGDAYSRGPDRAMLQASPSTPLAAAEAILAAIAGGGGSPRTASELESRGVPRTVCDRLRAAAVRHGVDEYVVVQLWIALLLDHLRERLADPTLLAAKPAQEFMAILGDRSMRDLRRSLARQLKRLRPEAW